MKTIDIFPWSHHFETGIKIIDTQHHQLVNILNRLATQVTYQTDSQELDTIFNELLEYTVYHFQTEEKIWNIYPENHQLDSQHKEMHQKFIDTILDLKKQRSEEPLYKLTNEVLDFLSKWLLTHILESDRYMAYVHLGLENNLNIKTAKEEAKNKMGGANRVLVDMITTIYSTLSINTMQLTQELQTNQIHSEKITYQDRYRQFLLELASSFINIPIEEIDSQIHTSLQGMATFVGADRTYIFDYDFNAKTTSNTYEWCADGIEPQIDNLQKTSLELLQDWSDKHKRGEYVLVQDTHLLEDENLRNILLPQGIKSLLTFPLFENGLCRGFIGFDMLKQVHKFSGVEIELLSFFSTLLSNVANRKTIETSLTLERNHFEHYLNTVEAMIISLNKDGVITLINTKGCNILGYTQEELLGKQWFDFCLPQPYGMKEVYPVFLSIVNGDYESFEYFENLVLTKSGKTKLIAWHNSYLNDEDNNIIGTLSAGEDITQRVESEKQLRLAASVFTHSRDGIMITSVENKIIQVNNAVSSMSGYPKNELIGKDPNILSSGKHTPSFYKNMWSEIIKKGFWSGEVWNKKKNGELFAEILTITAVKDANGKLIHYVGLLTDISQIKKHQSHLEFIAHYDSLTGLPNRVLLSDRLKQALAFTRRNKSITAVVYLDLDGFKDINDSYGHDAGDKLLTIVSDRMKKSLREGDTIARIGGDEFVIVLQNLHAQEESIPMLQRLLNAASEVAKINKHTMQVTASLGVSIFNFDDTTDADQLLRFADQAMYQAKLTGKNRYHIFDIENDTNIRLHHENTTMLDSAINNNEFMLYYQPKVNMSTGEVVGLEALIRWNHTTRGILTPDHFLPMIEGNHLIIKLGEWVIREAFTQVSDWYDKGLQTTVGINIDAAHLLYGNISKYLEKLFQKFPKVKPSNIVLEILETSALEDIVKATQVMHACKEMGIKFSLDDFGTGYSSLTYLKRLPASELKIDQSFVRDMLHDPDDLAILEGIISLASAFRRDIIAEGVESIQHGKVLLQLGCEIAQGYVIARPMPAKDIIKWIKTWKPYKEWHHVTAVDHDDFPVLYAIVEHLSWIKNVKKFLKNKSFSLEEESDTECRFGEWLSTHGVKYYGATVDFEAIQAIHFEIHEYANKLIRIKKSALAIQKKDIKTLKGLSLQLIGLLEELQSKK